MTPANPTPPSLTVFTAISSPWRGLSYFLAHPKWWALPIFATLMVSVFVLSVALGLGWWLWPHNADGIDIGWWTYLWQAGRSIGIALAAGLITWMIALPIAMSLAFEHLQQRIFKQYAIATPGESLLGGINSAVRSVISGLKAQLLWLVITLILSFIFPPLAIISGVWSIAYSVSRESYLSCLALRGVPYKQRQVFIQQQQSQLLAQGLSAAALQAILLLTLIGWVFWLPALFCGAAIAVTKDLDPKHNHSH